MKPNAALACLATILPAWAYAADGGACLEVTQEDGEVHFEIEQAGSAFGGTFLAFGGTVCRDGDSITAVSAWIDPGSVDTGLPELDTALKSGEFFAVEAHPRATFESDRVEASGDKFVAHGALEVKGISKPVDVPFQLARQGDAYHVSGRFEINRLDFGIGTGEWADTTWIGNVTTVTFAGELHLGAVSDRDPPVH